MYELVSFSMGMRPISWLALMVTSEELSHVLAKSPFVDVISGPNVAWSEQFSIALTILW